MTPHTQYPDTLGTASAVSAGVESLLAGAPLGITISAGRPLIYLGRISNASAFAQDTFHVNGRLSILYGLRWEVTPPRNADVSATGLGPVATWSGPGAAVNENGSFGELNKSTWPMNDTQLAPRLGLAYRLPGPALALRAGGGLFYETALGSLLNPGNFSPLSTWQYVPRNGTITPPTPAYVNTIPPALSLPRIWEWRASVERSIGDRSTLSLAYAGSVGSRLLRLEGTVDPTFGTLQQTYFTNYGASNYQALEAQFRGNLTPNLYTLISYTWGHSIDNESQGPLFF